MTLPSLRTIRAIMRREFLDVVRDRRSLFLTFLYPITMLIMYGYGIRFNVDNVQLTILDRSETPPSRALIQDLTSSGYFHLVRYAADEHNVERDLTTDSGACRGDHSVRFRRPSRGGQTDGGAGADRRLGLRITATIAQGYAARDRQYL